MNVKGHPVDFTGEVVAAISQTVTDDEMVGKIQRARVEARRRREMRNIPVHLGGEFGVEPLCCVTWDGCPFAAPPQVRIWRRILMTTWRPTTCC